MSRIAPIVDSAAAILFALCVATCLHLTGLDPFASVSLAALPGVGAHLLLGRVGRRDEEPLFWPAAFDFDEVPSDELLLDDPLEQPDPDSNVVRLFGAAGPKGEAPGVLAARIAEFLGTRRDGPSPTPEPDAAQELYEALAAIRQTLR